MQVVVRHSVWHGGAAYRAGDVIDVAPEAAARLLSLGVADAGAEKSQEKSQEKSVPAAKKAVKKAKK